MEILSMLGGAASGFIFKMLAQQQQLEKDRFDRMMQAIDKSDTSADKAAARVPNDKAGNWIRRFIVIAILFGVILAPFFLTLMGYTSIVQITTPVHNLFGLTFGGKTQFYELAGYLLSPEIRQSLICIISFYFGQSAAKT